MGKPGGPGCAGSERKAENGVLAWAGERRVAARGPGEGQRQQPCGAVSSGACLIHPLGVEALWADGQQADAANPPQSAREGPRHLMGASAPAVEASEQWLGRQWKGVSAIVDAFDKDR